MDLPENGMFCRYLLYIVRAGESFIWEIITHEHTKVTVYIYNRLCSFAFRSRYYKSDHIVMCASIILRLCYCYVDGYYKAKEVFLHLIKHIIKHMWCCKLSAHHAVADYDFIAHSYGTTAQKHTHEHWMNFMLTTTTRIYVGIRPLVV